MCLCVCGGLEMNYCDDHDRDHDDRVRREKIDFGVHLSIR